MTLYLPLLRQLDAWQADTAEAYPGIILCRPGCHACCHGPFDISVADAELIREAVAALPDPVRTAVGVRAAAQTARMRQSAPDLGVTLDVSLLSEQTLDGLCEAMAEEPCPCLDEAGRCLIYEARPMVCRVMGLGLRTTDGGDIPNACPIQKEFPDYASLPAQPFDLAAWEVREAAALTAAADRLGVAPTWETTVAGAVELAARG